MLAGTCRQPRSLPYMVTRRGITNNADQLMMTHSQMTVMGNPQFQQQLYLLSYHSL